MNDKEKQLKKIFKEIEECNDGKHDNKIIKLCDDGLKIDRKNIRLYLLKGDCLKRLGNYYNCYNYYTEAIKNYNIVRNLNPNETKTYHRIASCYFSLALKSNNVIEYMNNINSNLKILDICINLNKNDMEAYYRRAMTYLYLMSKVDNYKKYSYNCIEDFNIAIKNNPKCGKYYKDRSSYYFNIGKKTKNTDYLKLCINDLDKAMELGINDNEFYLTRNLCNFYLGNYHEAIKDLDKFITMAPNDETGYYRRAINYVNLYLLKNENYNEYYEMFEKDFNKAIELEPNDVSMLSAIVSFYYIFKEYNTCLKYCNKLINLNKKDYFAYYYKGLCYYQLKNYDDAIKNYNLSEKYSKYYYDKLNIQNKKIEILLILEKQENTIIDLYQNVILKLYKKIFNEKIFYTYNLFNILLSITKKLSYIKNKLDINENKIK